MSLPLTDIIGDWLKHRGVLLNVFTTPGGVVTTVPWTFAGFADLVANAAEYGLIASENGAGALTLAAADAGVSHDIYGLSSNLLLHGGVPWTGRDVSTYSGVPGAFALQNTNPWNDPLSSSNPRLPQMLARVTQENYEWRAVTAEDGAGGVVTGPNGALSVIRTTVYENAPVFGVLSSAFRVHATTVEEVCTGVFLRPYHPFQALSNPYGSFEGVDGVDGAEMILSASGPVLRFRLRIPLQYPLEFGMSGGVFDLRQSAALVAGQPSAFVLPADPSTGAPGAMSAWELVSREGDEGSEWGLELTYALPMTGYGWQNTVLADGGAWASPRTARRYATLAETESPDEWTHPNLLNQPHGADGGDFRIGLPAEKAEVERIEDREGIALLHDVTYAVPTRVPVFPAELFWKYNFLVPWNPDGLKGLSREVSEGSEAEFQTWYGVNRARLLAHERSAEDQEQMSWMLLWREHYNALAGLVNAVTACEPLNGFMVRHGVAGLATGWGTIAPNTRGLHGGRVRPVTQLAGVTEGSEEEAVWRALGVTIQTLADLPASYGTMAATVQTYATASVEIVKDYTFRSLNTWPSSIYIRFVHWDVAVSLGAKTLGTPVAGAVVDPALVAEWMGGTAHAEHHWVTITHAQAAIEAAGFLFRFEQLAVPLVLLQTTLTTADSIITVGKTTATFAETEDYAVSHPPGPFTGVPYTSPPANFTLTTEETLVTPMIHWQLVEAASVEEAEWVTDSGDRPTLDAEYGAGDVWTLLLPFGRPNIYSALPEDWPPLDEWYGGWIVFTFADVDARFLRRLQYETKSYLEVISPVHGGLLEYPRVKRGLMGCARPEGVPGHLVTRGLQNPGEPGYVVPDGPSVNNARINTRNLFDVAAARLWMQWASAEYALENRVVQLPCPAVRQAGAAYSLENDAQALGKCIHDVLAMPLMTVPAAGGGTVEALEDGNTLLTRATGAARVGVVQGWGVGV